HLRCARIPARLPARSPVRRARGLDRRIRRPDRDVAEDLELAPEPRARHVGAHRDRLLLLVLERIDVLGPGSEDEHARAAAPDRAAEVVRRVVLLAELEEGGADGDLEGLAGLEERQLGHGTGTLRHLAQGTRPEAVTSLRSGACASSCGPPSSPAISRAAR